MDINKKIAEISQISNFGGHASPYDYRDIALSAAIEPIELPPSYFVDISLLPVWYQRKLGACTGHAGAKYKQELDFITDKQIYSLSARFVYAMAKCQDGIVDEGTFPRLIFQIMKDSGVADESACVNDTTLDHETYVYNRKIENIPTAAIENAKQYKINSYAFLDRSLQDVKLACVRSYGASCLVKVGQEWYTSSQGVITWDKSQILPVKPPKVVISGHEIYVYGYEDTTDGDTKVWYRNSWSSDWGDAGNGYFMWSEYKDFFVEGITAVDAPKILIDNTSKLPEKFTYNFTKTLYYGLSNNIDVLHLQSALKLDGVYTGPLTGGYYTLTAAAVLMYQRKYGVASASEITSLRGMVVGPKTLAVLNKQFNK